MAASSEFDVAVVGGGAAGLWTALRAAEQGGSVCLISRTPLSQSASFWAQGGLAAALEPDDSPASHAADTIAAGRGLCRHSAVQVLVEEAPAAVRDLLARGVVFDLDHEGRLALGLEGGHASRRIVHSGGSQTGHELTSKLAAMVATETRIEVRERTSALALWSDGGRCHGVITDSGPIGAAATVLATGGAAALWRRTTNPRGAIGAGPVLAARAGAELVDLEFCQFHPTALALPDSRFDGVLITEAIRGEGAKLLDASGERFTDELAPRDAVTAAILDRMQADAAPDVALDLREIDPARFPNVFASLAEAGLDPRTEPVPVAPAAHYMMGGIAVDLDGRASLPGLYAVGECSCTGLHGANRLASNSLSECFVFGARAATAAVAEAGSAERPSPPEWEFQAPTQETRDAVWRRAGPKRNPDDLASLVSNPYPLASAIATCALNRRESRGGHLRTDCPETDPKLDGVHFVLSASGEVRREEWD
ncbi:MAG TPA: FAD-dependent oxidoreductase [Solirubrobacterales bacterium]|nr:FAD-dependent oxidoreductase [Solirubrobacterales bacterium]